MSDALTRFFAAWSETTLSAREARLEEALSHPFSYADPGTPHVIDELGQLADYIAADAARMPETHARVAATDHVGAALRARVDFHAGGAPFRTAQYFAIVDETGKIMQITGFNGTGDAAK